MSTVITPPIPSVPPTDQTTKADQADPPEVSQMQITSIDQAEALGLPIPCRAFDPEVFFAETPADVEYAKSLCGTCPVKDACLTGALERREPWGVWGGELFVQGVVVARKRPRGRPRKTEVAA
ncbi:WhiB family transcriptional regulator [Streptomyces sp. CB01881]|uniref:WhiB family transcriptional regulator n=1 Tax=Streptomyces sp. CB01881 TaxID=2078691 RepID=UPI001575BB3D|nr:WhiB family transcriptional regulator [Streptomyces sp. CB01881]